MQPILLFIGTRPEAIKLAPVVSALGDLARGEVVVCSSGQHRELLRGPLAAFGVRVDHELELGGEARSPDQLVAAVLPRLASIIDEVQPRVVVVQGDTATAFAGALAGHLRRVPVAHVEAGLRTSTPAAPWPEESFRRMITQLAAVHFAPTEHAAANLKREGVDPAAIHVTGNTVVDALRQTLGPKFGRAARPEGRYVLATFHRRESFGAAASQITAALAALPATSDVDVHVVGHPNPALRDHLLELAVARRVHVLAPLSHAQFLEELAGAMLVLTDSGGVQEEAPYVGTPVLIMRDETDRPEVVESGWGRVVGTNMDAIVSRAAAALDGREPFARGPAPFGDGRAAERIAAVLGSSG